MFFDMFFKVQQEVLKFNDICVSWSSPKTDMVTNFLDPENRLSKFRERLSSNF